MTSHSVDLWANSRSAPVKIQAYQLSESLFCMQSVSSMVVESLSISVLSDHVNSAHVHNLSLLWSGLE